MNLIKEFFKNIPTVANLYRSARDQVLLRKVIKYCPHLECKFSGSSAMHHGEFEKLETLFIKKNIDNFDLFINIGANIGYYTLIGLAKKKKVIAFEPNLLNAKILMRNIIENNFESSCEFHITALSNTVSIVPMYGSNTGASLIKGWAGQNDFVFVPTNKFDNIISNRFNQEKILILVDIEGAEYQYLLGAAKFLKTPTSLVFIIEISIGEHQPIGVKVNPNLVPTFKIFFDEGYICYRLDETFSQVNIEEVIKIAETGFDSIGTHNFIFINRYTKISDLKFN